MPLSARAGVHARSDGSRAADGTGPLVTLLYCSRAVAPMSAAELATLVEAAQRRNAAEGVTGLLIYDDGQFVQWLEGPPDSVERVWASTRRDARHSHVELLGRVPTNARFFPDWAMQLGSPRLAAPPLAGAIAAGLAEALGAAATHPDAPAARGAASPSPPLPRPDPQAATLAQQLAGAQGDSALALADRLQAAHRSLGTLAATLFEPAARALGDLWYADACNAIDVTVGLCGLHRLVRRVAQARWGTALTNASLGRVLVVTPPGETHLLGAVLDAEVLWQSGWQVQCEFPETPQALEQLLATQWFDALDLSLSPVLRQAHRLAPLARLIAQARQASRNPALRVVVGGRVFHDRIHTAQQVGADAASRSALQVGALLRPPRTRSIHL
jgi:hypothetical protein